jgi:hypothetical protein
MEVDELIVQERDEDDEKNFLLTSWNSFYGNVVDSSMDLFDSIKENPESFVNSKYLGIISLMKSFFFFFFYFLIFIYLYL